MYTASVMCNFCSENRLSKILFSNPFPKKCSDCESQKSTHQSADFMDSWSVFGFALQKNAKSVFGFRNPDLGYPLKNAPSKILNWEGFHLTTFCLHKWYCWLIKGLLKLHKAKDKTMRKTYIVINCVKLKFKTDEKDVHCLVKCLIL